MEACFPKKGKRVSRFFFSKYNKKNDKNNNQYQNQRETSLTRTRHPISLFINTISFTLLKNLILFLHVYILFVRIVFDTSRCETVTTGHLFGLLLLISSIIRGDCRLTPVFMVKGDFTRSRGISLLIKVQAMSFTLPDGPCNVPYVSLLSYRVSFLFLSSCL